MFSVTKKIHFSYAHRLLHHKGKCFRLHGHNGVAEITCAHADLNQNNMVVDFDEITAALKNWIDTTIDHRAIINKEDKPLIDMLTSSNEEHLVVDGDPTAELIAKLIFDQAEENGLPVTKVTLWETPNSSATYQPV